jgi:hypothetical protein
MHLVGRRIGCRPLLDDAANLGVAAEIDAFARHGKFEEFLIAKDLTLAGIGKNDEFVAEIAADPVSARIGIAFNPMRVKVRR